jgi:cyanophycinase
MHFPSFILTGLLTTITMASPVCTKFPNTTTTVGPPNGHLVIIGGNLQSDSIWEKIISLAGGPSAPIVVIPTAGGADSYNDSYAPVQSFRNLGATNVTLLHTYDPAEANTDEFVAPLREAKGVFFGGGRQWRLVDAYAGTQSESLFRAVLDRGGVISGSSAGASIQGSFLARGDTANNQIMIGDHTVGFGYMRNTAIDQHVLVRNRHFDMFDILRKYPELLGISVDEDTALIVQGDEMEVFGRTYALIYDGSFYSDEGTDLKTIPPKDVRFYFLRAGQKYDLAKRQVIEDEAMAAEGRDEL